MRRYSRPDFWKRLLPHLVGLALVVNMQSLYSQPNFSIHLSGGGVGMSFLSITGELKLATIDSMSPIQSIRLAVSYGVPMLNASYLPVEARVVLFRGSNHIDVSVAANIQVAYRQPNNDGWRDVSSASVVPAIAFVYRYEPETGGFTFRAGPTFMYWAKDDWPVFGYTIGYGYSW